MQLPNPLEINPNTLCQLHRYGLDLVNLFSSVAGKEDERASCRAVAIQSLARVPKIVHASKGRTARQPIFSRNGTTEGCGGEPRRPQILRYLTLARKTHARAKK
jgi:hypothetical protein